MPAKIKEKGVSRGTKILKCNCIHSYQDTIYGKNRRAMNPCKDGRAYRCTVCGKEKGV